ncbi:MULTISPECIES: ABC transporter permease [unclassified Microbacterium]|uniref:ABC transporter permease n=1 Tax=unclassified Microbacterium TaxID=2609290 RepID=UPI000CFAD50A|nr:MULTISPECIES: ABC transporter permease [unclassified Microbacterium]PQZ60167.1 ribose ABC transporter permease [Microbacterium sp. MYb43]PQZ75848.1 ribose ABC transporter permease [Microbacterium sp. MYb40]PRB23209.1 ribose ABC transporter permease [Microbacterium sp. MYb54]PRB28114.1 ribose ABC transporter permease [Microbacterium sp. MYb50]PRB66165.1 ribose ABC transporter permease [Microbacterium sp. MYb24]
MTTTDIVAVGNRPRLERRPLRNLLVRPEMGALVAALAVMIFFSAYTQSFMTAAGAGVWLESASTFGIMAVAVALLMIGGEFDLSAGVLTGFTALVVGVLTTQYGLNIWLAVLVSLVLALSIGALNGILVMKTGLPSFIITLGTFFVLAGVDLAVTKLITGQVAIQGMTKVPFYDSIQPLFGSSISIGGGTFYISVLWWFIVTAVATWVLLRTRPGNWIFAVGGAATASRQVGVPVLKTKIGLFMVTAGAAWLVGMISLFRTSTVQANTGVGQEFIYIICAVVGGCLMTGGFGSAIGAALGALIYGMVFQGITFAQWDTNWLRTFLGAMLLLAVFLNHWVRLRAGGVK